MSPLDIEALIRAGLYDPDSPGAADRLELLEHLSGRGISVERMADADRIGRLVFAASDQTLLPSGRRRTLEQVAAETGMTVERVARIRMAAGLSADPEAVVVSAGFSQTLRAFDDGAAFFGENATLAFTRVIGSAVRRVAEAATSLFSAEVAPELTSELQFAEATELGQALAATIAPVMESLLWEHWFEIASEPAQAHNVVHAGEERQLAVGFVDLTGSTAWAESLSLRYHDVALARFDTAAWDSAAEHRVRVVKMIGDEAMFVSVDTAALVRTATDVCDAVRDDPDLPGARGAVGFGPVLSRQGDYFGPVVNLTARCVRLAEPGSVVVTDAARATLADAVWEQALESMAPRHVPGLSDPVTVHRVTARRAGGPPGRDDSAPQTPSVRAEARRGQNPSETKEST